MTSSSYATRRLKIVDHQINVALGTSLELNNHSLSNNHSLGKINNNKNSPK